MAPRYLIEKKLLFCVLKEEENYDSTPSFNLNERKSRFTASGVSQGAITDGENSVYYTYMSSCAEAPAIPLGKKSFAQINKSMDGSTAG